MASKPGLPSIHYAAHVMLVALGEPPGPPLGCIQLMIGCISCMGQYSSFQGDPMFSVYHHELVYRWMYFISVPRDQEQLDALERAMQPCRCHENRVGALDRNRAFHNIGIRVLGKTEFMAGHMLNLFARHLAPYLCQRKPKELAKICRSRRQPRDIVFPRSLDDVLPCGLYPTIQTLIYWLTTTQSNDVFDLLRGLTNGLGPAVIPAFIASPGIMRFLAHRVKRLHHTLITEENMVEDDMTRTAQELADISYFFASLKQLTQWSIMELVAIATADMDPTLCIVLCNDIITAGEIANAYPYVTHLPPLRYTPPLRKSYNEPRKKRNCVEDFAAFGACVLLEKRGDIRIRPIHDSIIAQAKILAEQEDVGIHALSRAIAHFEYGERCGSPQCLRTHALARRKFKRCGRCYVVSYCSTACQELAWKYGPAPHRAICRQLGYMRSLKDPQNADIPSQVLHAAVKNLKNLRMASFEHLMRAVRELRAC